MGVWIETYHQEDDGTFPESHPAWVCGLKRNATYDDAGTMESHPAWVCGLKLSLTEMINLCISHTLRGCVD